MIGIIRSCPICGASPHRAPLFVEDTLDASRLSNASFAEVVGVEPSLAAIAAAPAERRAWIRGGVFDQSDFVAESFDLICCFMTLEHVLDPMALATAAWRLLRPNGALITVTHDYR